MTTYTVPQIFLPSKWDELRFETFTNNVLKMYHLNDIPR